MANYSALTTELQKPEYAGLTDADALAKLLAATETEVYSRRIDERDALNGMLANSTQVDAFLAKLETIGQLNNLIGRVLKWFSLAADQGGGLDVGNPRVRAEAAKLVGTAGITQAEIDSLLALAERSRSPATRIGWQDVELAHVRDARQMIGA